RRVLEVEMVALAASRITPEQMTQLHQICKQMRERQNTAKQMAELDFRLHVTLAEATQNDLFKVLLAPLIHQLRDQIILTWEDFPRPAEEVFDQHEAIVTAVQNGNADAARQAMTKHLMFSRQVLEDISKARKDKNHEK
ncbi:MAG TPA: FCD domain-containing protein, partial [Anaerolineales bacterium]|nr:FCD domain-containing protein [Anaerolineales bacterium]